MAIRIFTTSINYHPLWGAARVPPLPHTLCSMPRYVSVAIDARPSFHLHPSRVRRRHRSCRARSPRCASAIGAAILPFCCYAALNLNLQKTLLIPTGPFREENTNLLHQVGRSTVDTSQTKGRYLGIILGPSATPQDTLNSILTKFHARAAHWSNTSLPPSYRIRVYNMFIHPLFSYYAPFFGSHPLLLRPSTRVSGP